MEEDNIKSLADLKKFADEEIMKRNAARETNVNINDSAIHNNLMSQIDEILDTGFPHLDENERQEAKNKLMLKFLDRPGVRY